MQSHKFKIPNRRDPDRPEKFSVTICLPDEEAPALVCADQSIWKSVHWSEGPDTNTRRHERLRTLCAERERWETELCLQLESNRERKYKYSVLPATVWQREHLQGGTTCWVGGRYHSGLGHTHHSLDDPLTEQHLQQAGARQHPGDEATYTQLSFISETPKLLTAGTEHN